MSHPLFILFAIVLGMTLLDLGSLARVGDKMNSLVFVGDWLESLGLHGIPGMFNVGRHLPPLEAVAHKLSFSMFLTRG